MKRFFLLTHLLSLVVFFTTISSGSGCTCEIKTNRQLFCGADFSVIGKPYYCGLRYFGSWLYVRYCVNVNRIIKPPLVDGWIYVYTPLSSAMCGITLQDGETYIINGWITTDNYAMTNLCQWVQRWEDVSDSDKWCVNNPGVCCWLRGIPGLGSYPKVVFLNQ